MLKRALWALFLALLISLPALFVLRDHIPTPMKEKVGLRAGISEVRAKQHPLLIAAFAQKGLTFGAPVYLRIFKEEALLELWSETADGTYALFRSYAICNYSGDLGPKLREGDRQSPEGFYSVSKSALNPNSQFHLSFNLGFPNAFDRSQGRTGSYLMVHGDCVSVGCYAMTDAAIEEIYVTLEAALRNGQQSVPVHAFPFKITPKRMAQAADNSWHHFWQGLAPAYDLFEATRRPPQVSIKDTHYVVTEG
ncbi:MAG: murein L,D-transpeptidase [Shimia sp.]|nr:murein L,D-transpeptidase [Shimia sp.]